MNEMVTTVAGNVATDVKHVVGSTGKPRTSFRLATASWSRQADGSYADGPTSFLNVTCFDTLAINVAACVRKGQPVVVTGTLTVREYEVDGRPGRSVDMVVRHLGHDLRLGQAAFARQQRRQPAATEQATGQATGQPPVEPAAGQATGRASAVEPAA